MKLVIINGPCGIGKSTAAEVVHEALRMSLLLDIDSQRRLYSGYKDNADRSTPLAQATSLAMAEVALSSGCDVIVDKMQYFPDWYEEWIQLGSDTQSTTLEFVLWASKTAVLARADKRGYAPLGQPGGTLTHDKVEFFWEKINEFKGTRPAVHVIDAEHQGPDAVANQVLDIINS